MKTEIMKITPETAKAFLATSSGNRTMRPAHVAALAGAMRRGEWRITNQGIGFDVNNALRDGHHRLQACIEAGVTIETAVTTGLPLDAYDVIDIGALRRYHDRLNEPKNITEIYTAGANQIYGGNYTLDQLRPVADVLRPAAELLIGNCPSNAQYFSSANMKLGACVMMLAGHDNDFILEQYRALVSKDYQAMTQIAQVLTRQVEKGKIKSADRRETIARALLVFHPARARFKQIAVNENEMSRAAEYVREFLKGRMK